MDQQPPASSSGTWMPWTLLGLASKDMVELFAFTTLDMGLATLWWKLHLEESGKRLGSCGKGWKTLGKCWENGEKNKDIVGNTMGNNYGGRMVEKYEKLREN